MHKITCTCYYHAVVGNDSHACFTVREITLEAFHYLTIRDSLSRVKGS